MSHEVSWSIFTGVDERGNATTCITDRDDDRSCDTLLERTTRVVGAKRNDQWDEGVSSSCGEEESDILDTGSSSADEEDESESARERADDDEGSSDLFPVAKPAC